MRQFVIGAVLGSLLTGTLVGAGDYLHQGGSGTGDYLGRSETQQAFDYFRSRAQALDIEHMRRVQDEERLNNIIGIARNPCPK